MVQSQCPLGTALGSSAFFITEPMFCSLPALREARGLPNQRRHSPLGRSGPRQPKPGQAEPAVTAANTAPGAGSPKLHSFKPKAPAEAAKSLPGQGLLLQQDPPLPLVSSEQGFPLFLGGVPHSALRGYWVAGRAEVQRRNACCEWRASASCQCCPGPGHRRVLQLAYWSSCLVPGAQGQAAGSGWPLEAATAPTAGEQHLK